MPDHLLPNIGVPGQYRKMASRFSKPNAMSVCLLTFHLRIRGFTWRPLLLVRVLLASVRIGTGFGLECRGLGNFPLPNAWLKLFASFV